MCRFVLTSLGPLLWHWADIHGEQSIELSYEDLRHIITETFGFILHVRIVLLCMYLCAVSAV